MAKNDPQSTHVEAEAVIQLSAEDQLCLAAALINPPLPNEALKRAMRAHAERVEVR